MRHLANVLVPLALVGVVLAMTPDSASAKCSRSMGTVLPGTMFVVDEVAVGDGAFEDFDPADVWSIQVTCRDVTPADAQTRVFQTAVEVMTVSGAAAVMEARLRDLVVAQRAHFAARGGYAATLAELGFPVTRSSHAIRITVTETGWSASSGSPLLGTECQVAFGAVEGQPEPATGVVTCRAVGKG